MPRAVARAWVSNEGPWGLCKVAGARVYLTGSAWATADAAEDPVTGAAWDPVPDAPWSPAGRGGVGGGGGGGTTDETGPSCVPVSGGHGGGVCVWDGVSVCAGSPAVVIVPVLSATGASGTRLIVAALVAAACSTVVGGLDMSETCGGAWGDALAWNRGLRCGCLQGFFRVVVSWVGR
jgi:hypothetical protein